MNQAIAVWVFILHKSSIDKFLIQIYMWYEMKWLHNWHNPTADSLQLAVQYK